MTISETNCLLKRIYGAYGRHFIISEFSVDEWHFYLKKYQFNQIKEKLDCHIRSKRNPPKIGHLLL